ncbi:hypothetical protein GCM10022247_18480 [Allokutzneria multivorans]|uniref:Peptidase C14 caspase domain-containing protein n=1 Tax=Allokutzneria multivorans TaxID=1142134 RepID=A0ABP7RJV5_9PSEU
MAANLPNPALSRAILIGTSDFQQDKLNPLPAVRNNLTDLARALTDADTGILPSEHCNIVDSPDSPASFMTRLRRTAEQAEDLLLVYYAGHGLRHQTEEKLYLTVHQSDPDGPEGTAVPFEWVRGVLENSTARTRLLVLDCCYSGIAVGAMSSEVLDPRDIAVAGTCVISSAPRNRVAHSPAGERHTAFTAELISVLTDGTRFPGEAVTVNSLYRSLRSGLANRDLPSPKIKLSETSGDLVLRRTAETLRREPRPTPPPPPLEVPVAAIPPEPTAHPIRDLAWARQIAVERATALLAQLPIKRPLGAFGEFLLWFGTLYGISWGIGCVTIASLGHSGVAQSVNDFSIGSAAAAIGAVCATVMFVRGRRNPARSPVAVLSRAARWMLYTFATFCSFAFASALFQGTTSSTTTSASGLAVHVSMLIFMAAVVAVCGVGLVLQRGPTPKPGSQRL